MPIQEIVDPVLAALAGPLQKIFSLPYIKKYFYIKYYRNYFFAFTLSRIQYFNSFVPTAQQAGPAVVLGRLSLNMCL